VATKQLLQERRDATLSVEGRQAGSRAEHAETKMPRWSLFLIFFTIAVTVVTAVHYYIYRRLVVSPALPMPWATITRFTLIALAASIPLSFLVARLLDTKVSRYVLFPVYVWMGLMLMFFFLLLSLELVRGLTWILARVGRYQDLLADPARRLFLSRVLAGTATGTVFAAAAVGIARGLGKLVVKPVEVTLPKLPRELDGFRIAQLTDLHLGPMRSRDWLAEVVRKTNAARPDLVAITGDLVDGTVEQLADTVEPLRALKAPHGVFFTTGNHEYFTDLHGWLAHLPKLGLRVLRNERVPVERSGARFDLAGVDDEEGRRFAPGHGADVARAMKGRDADRAVVLLAHQPRTVEDAARHGVELMLSGHTHGGQIWPWRYLVRLQQPYVSGLHDHEGTQIYVSEGTGFWGPPIRLGTTAEITMVILRSPAAAG
jgi:predicted MPP superfamily phosphohydrolase